MAAYGVRHIEKHGAAPAFMISFIMLATLATTAWHLGSRMVCVSRCTSLASLSLCFGY
jgi:hypothetical protein